MNIVKQREGWAAGERIRTMRNSSFSGYSVLYILVKFIVMNAEFRT